MASAPRWSFVHTWRQRIDTRTKAEGLELLRAWKLEKESAGWNVVGSLSRGSLMAFAPEADVQAELERCRRGEEPRLAASAAVVKIDFPSFPPTG